MMESEKIQIRAQTTFEVMKMFVLYIQKARFSARDTFIVHQSSFKYVN